MTKIFTGLPANSFCTPLNRVVVPLQRDFVFIELGGCRTEVDFTDFSAASGVASNGHEKMLPFAYRFTSTVRFDPE